ncbi:MAG: DUF882 domain-containing protein [Pseudomonadota bacterium]|nr:DUF882 domain-containing protein [Pseudomonadota bacterium]
MQPFSRRQFVKLGLCAASLATLPRMAWASAPARQLSFYHIHTGESVRLAYFENGRYMPGALQELNHFLRDWRTSDAHDIDPALFDQLYTLQQLVDMPGTYHVICGYRSPKTNQMLHSHSDGVAAHSLHLEGRAIDIYLPGKDLSLLHKAALSMQAGGIGYYPGSGFIHMDTGRVRHWG